ncbi:hypothetical protein QR680_011287 [Steinernema hermaphroditum]|uniref:Uncharacterized protein n=1 Tax=Steinernema hermaphroditum TaxID=289476 RepID=A0AA39MCK8_9BILA|nr:hypothetical protein QR680_011287 [Steinernema hermaphroditum]
MVGVDKDLLELVQLELKEIRDRADSALRKLASIQSGQVFENVDLNGPTSEQNGPLEPVCNDAPEPKPDQHAWRRTSKSSTLSSKEFTGRTPTWSNSSGILTSRQNYWRTAEGCW